MDLLVVLGNTVSIVIEHREKVSFFSVLLDVGLINNMHPLHLALYNNKNNAL